MPCHRWLTEKVAEEKKALEGRVGWAGYCCHIRMLLPLHFLWGGANKHFPEDVCSPFVKQFESWGLCSDSCFYLAGARKWKNGEKRGVRRALPSSQLVPSSLLSSRPMVLGCTSQLPPGTATATSTEPCLCLQPTEQCHQ